MADQYTIEDYRSEFSDFHKEAHGHRPRFDTSTWDLARWEAEWQSLRFFASARFEEEQAAEAAAIVEFEANIVRLIELGAADRDAAIRWVADAEGVDGDMQYLCFCLSLPYGYFATPVAQGV